MKDRGKDALPLNIQYRTWSNLRKAYSDGLSATFNHHRSVSI